jgi:hypothetical protein
MRVCYIMDTHPHYLYKKYNTKLTLPKFSESVIVQPAVTLLDKYAYYNF